MDRKAKARGAGKRDNAAQDAGWVHLISEDGALDYGRGHLKMWMERPDTNLGRQAELVSFTPGLLEPQRGAGVVIQPEGEGAADPVVVTRYDRGEDSTVMLLNWVADDDVPASLRELGATEPAPVSRSDRVMPHEWRWRCSSRSQRG